MAGKFPKIHCWDPTPGASETPAGGTPEPPLAASGAGVGATSHWGPEGGTDVEGGSLGLASGDPSRPGSREGASREELFADPACVLGHCHGVAHGPRVREDLVVVAALQRHEASVRTACLRWAVTRGCSHKEPAASVLSFPKRTVSTVTAEKGLITSTAIQLSTCNYTQEGNHGVLVRIYLWLTFL